MRVCVCGDEVVTCSVSPYPAVSGSPCSSSPPGSSPPPASTSRRPTASPSPSARRSGSPAPWPAPPAWCTWSSASQGSGAKQQLDDNEQCVYCNTLQYLLSGDILRWEKQCFSPHCVRFLLIRNRDLVAVIYIHFGGLEKNLGGRPLSLRKKPHPKVWGFVILGCGQECRNLHIEMCNNTLKS